jgi:hypothetical protein
MSDKTIIWVHGDALSAESPPFVRHPDAPAIFVFDESLLREWGISFKRVVFMYECLLEMPVTIRRGDVAQEVVAFAREHGATRIVTTGSVSPRFRKLCKAISQAMPSGSRLEVLADEPLVDDDGYFDLKRFSRYWGKAKNRAMGR